MKPIIIAGSGGHARSLAGLIRARDETFRLAGYTSPKPMASEELGPYLGDDDLFTSLAAKGYSAAIGVGGVADNSLRIAVFEKARGAGLNLPALVHARAMVAQDVYLGAGTVVMAGAIIQPGVR